MICIETKHWRRVFSAWADIMRENRDYLIELDGVAGDSDLGLTMTDGFAAARDAVLDFEGDDAGRLLYTGGKAIMRHAPSSLGTLLGSGFLEAGKRLKGREALPLDEAYRLFEAIEENIMARGGAKVGEKTFLDGIDPAVRALRTADWSAPRRTPGWQRSVSRRRGTPALWSTASSQVWVSAPNIWLVEAMVYSVDFSPVRK